MNVFIVRPDETGVYTALYAAYTRKTFPDAVTDGNCQLALDAQIIEPGADAAAAARVREAVRKYGGERAVREAADALRAGTPDKCSVVFYYLRRMLDERKNVRHMLALPEVFAFEDVLKKIYAEVHRMAGFMRFQETLSGAYYAHYEPDHDVTQLLMPHFVSRFRAMSFAIHDVRRNVIGLWNGDRVAIAPCDRPVTVFLSDREQELTRLWKTYYHAVNIAERPHDKQMRGYMPRRYWAHLPEKQP